MALISSVMRAALDAHEKDMTQALRRHISTIYIVYRPTNLILLKQTQNGSPLKEFLTGSWLSYDVVLIMQSSLTCNYP